VFPFLVDSGRNPSIFDVVRDRYGIKRRRSATTTLAFSTLQAVRGMSPGGSIHPLFGRERLPRRCQGEHQGVAVRDGHTDSRTTTDLYIHLYPDADRPLADALEARLEENLNGSAA
jgi:hypothetical protein